MVKTKLIVGFLFGAIAVRPVIGLVEGDPADKSEAERITIAIDEIFKADLGDKIAVKEIYALTRKHDPILFNSLMLDLYTAVYIEKLPTAQAAARVRMQIAEGMTKRLTRMTDRALIDYTHALVNQLDLMQKIDASVCVAVLKSAYTGMFKGFPKELYELELEMTRASFDLLDTDPIIPSEAEAISHFGQVISGLEEQTLDDFLTFSDEIDGNTQSDLSDERKCASFAGVFGEILTLPDPVNSEVLRYFYSPS